jgi:hypothetical protein
MTIKNHHTWLIAGGSIIVVGAVLGSYSIWTHANATRLELNQNLILETMDNSMDSFETVNNTTANKKVVKPKPIANQQENSNSIADDGTNDDPPDNSIADEPNNGINDSDGGGSSSSDNQAPWEQGPSDQ